MIELNTGMHPTTPSVLTSHNELRDSATATSVRAILAASPLSDHAYVTVDVCDGLLTLSGTVSDGLLLARFKNQVTAAVPSLVIEDKLDWVVPDCGIGVA